MKKKTTDKGLQQYIDHLVTFNAKLTPDGFILIANKTAAEAIGCSSAELVGKHFTETPW